MYSIEFNSHRIEIYHGTCTDDAHSFRIEYSRRNDMESKLAFFIYYRMSRVITTLVTDYQIGFLSKIINNPSFSFISPLGAYNCGYAHRFSFLIEAQASLSSIAFSHASCSSMFSASQGYLIHTSGISIPAKYRFMSGGKSSSFGFSL